jgi:Cytotoxic translational repressor of toxin-antitoxin stability system
MNEYHVEISLKLLKEFKKLKKKNLPLLIAVNKKVEEIKLDPQSYKNLNAPMNNLKRVHVGSFVLLFSVNEQTKTITLEYFEHHDDAY